jgi:hypothetical protein
MTLRPIPAGVHFLEQDHPGLPNALIGKLRAEHDNRAQQIIEGAAQDWADYKGRVEYLRALRDAIMMCEEAQKMLMGG